jgi:hypothetical protein
VETSGICTNEKPEIENLPPPVSSLHQGLNDMVVTVEVAVTVKSTFNVALPSEAEGKRTKLVEKFPNINVGLA